MARRPRTNQERELILLIAKLEPELRAAFAASIRDLRNGVLIQDMLNALRRGDVEAALDALRIEPAAFSTFQQAKANAFMQGGIATAATIPPSDTGSVSVRFDMTNPRAENWIRQNVGQRIVEIADDTMFAARETILTGFQGGRHPNNIAVDVVGRVVNGRRVGGVLGLDSNRARWLTDVTRLMETPEGVASMVIERADGTLELRRFGGSINAATRNRIFAAYRRGTAVPKSQREVSVRQYQNALLKARGDTVARTETSQAVRGAQFEEWTQLIERRNLPPEAIIKTWVHGGGVKDPRWYHVQMNGQSVRGLDTEFELPNGDRMKCPHEAGKPARMTVNCTCGLRIRLDHAFGLT